MSNIEHSTHSYFIDENYNTRFEDQISLNNHFWSGPFLFKDIFIISYFHIGQSRIRLASGENEREGRVEVFNDGEWGTVCDDAFNHEDAQVVCRQLGFTGAIATVAEYGHRFGEGDGRIWLDDLNCDGTETELWECPNSGWGNHNCGHHEDVAVFCEEMGPEPGIFHVTLVLKDFIFYAQENLVSGLFKES